MPDAPRYVAIQGSFTIFYPDAPRNGPEPDGDTITFAPRDPAIVRRLKRYGTIGPKLNSRGNVPIRLEAVDALETHFLGLHQSLDLAQQARAFLLESLGFRGVVFWDDAPNKVRAVANNPRPGHVIANGVDGNGRVLGFVYPGKSPVADGAPVFVETKQFDASINARLLRAGLAYAELYTSLPLALAKHARRLAEQARKAKRAIYGAESINTRRAAAIPGIDALEKLVMFPKLFRRLADYFKDGNAGLAAFDGWMREDPVNRDDTLLLPDGELGNMHDLYVVSGDRLRMTLDPEQVTILPDQPVPVRMVA